MRKSPAILTDKVYAASGVATDNHALAPKLELRRRLLQGRSDLRVLDCFAGEEKIWCVLRDELPVTDYLSFDLRVRRARLKADSLRFVKQPQTRFNVVDLDAYGAPWEHFESVLAWKKDLFVFLTVGMVGMRRASHTGMRLAGVPENAPIGMHFQLSEIILQRCLSYPWELGYEITDAREAINPGTGTGTSRKGLGNARYFGLALRWNPEKNP